MTDQTTVSGSDAGRQDEQPQGHLALSTTQAVQGLDAAPAPDPLDRCKQIRGRVAELEAEVERLTAEHNTLLGTGVVDAGDIAWAVQSLDAAAGVAFPHSRPRCGKRSGMCAMVPDGAGNPATGICPECGVDCGNAGVDGIRYTSWCDEHGRATPCDKCQQTTNWPETVLMVRAWFEGNADAALVELEHRAATPGATT